MANPPSPFGIMVQQTICLKMDASIQSFFAAIESARLAIVTALNAFKSYLRSIVDSLTQADELANALAQFNSQINDIIPDPTDFNRVNAMIQACTYLNTSDILGKPAALLKDAIDSILGIGGYIDKMLEDLANTLTIPEFLASINLSSLTTLFQQLGVISNMEAIKKLIQCLSAICGIPVTAYINKLSEIYRDFYLTDTGDINVVQLVADSGIPYGKRGPVITALTSIKAKRSQLSSILNNAVDGFRALGR